METPVSQAESASECSRREVVDHAKELYEDLDFAAVRKYLEENPGCKAIGFMPIYVPREVFHAAGILPVGVMGGSDRLEIVRGDAYYQSYICHIPRSTLELGLNGALDVLDGMIFPSICDVIRNLSGMWKMLFPDKYVKYLDVPQNFDDRVGGEFYARELRDLIRDLEGLSGREVSEEALRHSIGVYNENRRLIRELYDCRVRTPWHVPSTELYLLLRASNVLPVEAHSKMLKTYLEALRTSERKPKDMARVLLRGCFCEQPPADLVKTLERSGCYIVDDDWVMGARWIQGDIDLSGDPLEALVSAFLHQSPKCPSMYLDKGRKGDALVEEVKQAKAEGVLFTAPSFCDPALLDQPMTQAAIEREGIPCTSFLFSENTGQFQVIREQAGTFADAIKLS
jgi:benzoyl-CoA reductase subunit C